MKRQRRYVIYIEMKDGRFIPMALVDADNAEKAVERYHSYHKTQANHDTRIGCPVSAVAQSRVSRYDLDHASDCHITSDTTKWPYYPDGCLYAAGRKPVEEAKP